MKEKDQNHLFFQTNHEHVHAFFQDLGLALNRITRLSSKGNSVFCHSKQSPLLPTPVERMVESNHEKWPEERVLTV
jgi:hypothetical protein